VLLVKVDAIGPKPAQAGLDRLDNACPPANGLVIDIIDAVLGGDHHLVAARAERATDKLLRPARADEGIDTVFLRRVDKVDPPIECGMDDARRRVLITLAAEEIRPEVIAAEAHDRDRKLTDAAPFHSRSFPCRPVRSDPQNTSGSMVTGKPIFKANLQLIGPQSASLQVVLVFADLAATLP